VIASYLLLLEFKQNTPINLRSQIVPSPARSAFIDFLVTGELPRATNQTFATIYEPGSKRDPIPDPYAVPVGSAAGDMGGTQ